MSLFTGSQHWAFEPNQWAFEPNDTVYHILNRKVDWKFGDDHDSLNSWIITSDYYVFNDTKGYW